MIRPIINLKNPVKTKSVTSKEVIISDESISRIWKIIQNATNRDLEAVLSDTSSMPINVKFSHASGKIRMWMDALLLESTSTNDISRGGATLNFGTING
ncbi:hypothetical protein ABEY80_15820 [Priestia megaterium]